MNGLTNYITEVPWEETITEWYAHVDDSYQKICPRLKKPVRSRGPEPVLSDSEVITIGLIIDSTFRYGVELPDFIIRPKRLR